MPQNAAIYYHAEGYDTSGDRLMGRHAAGEGFLTGLIRHSGVSPFVCFARGQEDFADFSRRLETLGGTAQPTRWIPHARSAELADPGCLYYPGPNLGELAWLRRAVNPAAYSLCGVTHTTASEGVMTALGQLLSAPFQPWDALICTSEAVRDSVRSLLDDWADYLDAKFGGRAVSPVELPVIPLGVDCDGLDRPEQAGAAQAEWRKRLGIAADDIALLFVGRLSYHAKAHPLPMYLGLEVASKRTGVRLHLIQAGWFANQAIERQFKEAAERFCPSVRAAFVDGRKPEVRASIWHAADIFTSLSDNIQETFGLTPLEAMAAGLPVVVSDWNGYRATVRDGIDGFMVPSVLPPAGAGHDLAFRYAAGLDNYDRYLGHVSQSAGIDTEATAEAYSRLIADPALRRRFGEAGRQYARERFDWRVVIAAYQDLWTELAARRAKADIVAPRAAGRPANPLRPDPFALFAGYPSHVLGPDDRIALAPGAGAGKLAVFLAEPTTNLAAGLFAPRAECEQLVSTLAETGPRSVGDILSPLDPANSVVMQRTLVWLAKTGVVRILFADDGLR